MTDLSPVKKANILVICGPTASGKTAYGVQTALRYTGEILSVDSRQVYRNMNIGTGKDLQEYSIGGKTIPYHLIDIADPAEMYTLWHFQKDFYEAFRTVREKNRLPIAVGGTGLYLEAVLKNYQIPNVPEDVALRQELMSESKEKLRELLRGLSEELCAKTDMSSKKRIVRSIEIARYEKNHAVRWGHGNPPQFKPLILVVTLPREVLRMRIKRRLEQRFAQGMVEEVKELIDRGISEERLNLFGLEYKYISAFLYGRLSFQEMKDTLYQHICRFAKRQDTWFRGMPRRGLQTVSVPAGSFKIIEDLLCDVDFY